MFKKVNDLRFSCSSGQVCEGKVIVEVHHHHFHHHSAPPQTMRRRGFWDWLGRRWGSIPPAQRTAMIIVFAALLTLCSH